MDNVLFTLSLSVCSPFSRFPADVLGRSFSHYVILFLSLKAGSQEAENSETSPQKAFLRLLWLKNLKWTVLPAFLRETKLYSSHPTMEKLDESVNVVEQSLHVESQRFEQRIQHTKSTGFTSHLLLCVILKSCVSNLNLIEQMSDFHWGSRSFFCSALQGCGSQRTSLNQPEIVQKPTFHNSPAGKRVNGEDDYCFQR